MTRTMKRATGWALIACLGAALIPQNATAWGPKAERSLAVMAMQLIQREHPNVFTPTSGDQYVNDVYRGANDGLAAIGDVPLIGEVEVFKAIEEEIRLLRDARVFGPTSYFAYRMGALSTLVGNVMLPFGYSQDTEEQRIRQYISGEFERHLESYRIATQRRGLELIEDAQYHFTKHRGFYYSNEQRLADEFRRGVSYENGFLKQVASVIYLDSASAIADAWHTVLTATPETVSGIVARPRLAEYFVEEINYLLNVKDNYYKANRVYQNLRRVNPDDSEVFERVGDLYYNYGQAEDMAESIERGVREWQVAHEKRGATHLQISRKLANHFLGVGKSHLEVGQQKGSSNDELPSAMQQFETALKYDPINREAPDLIEKTQRAIKERQEMIETRLSILAGADEIRESGDKSYERQDYGKAISDYGEAINLYEGVDDYFTDLYDTAQDNIDEVKKEINAAVKRVEDQANDAISDGDNALEDMNFDGAINNYTRAIQILEQIPEDSDNTSALNMKRTTMEAAETKIEDAKTAQAAEEARRAALNPQVPGQSVPPRQ